MESRLLFRTSERQSASQSFAPDPEKILFNWMAKKTELSRKLQLIQGEMNIIRLRLDIVNSSEDFREQQEEAVLQVRLKTLLGEVDTIHAGMFQVRLNLETYMSPLPTEEDIQGDSQEGVMV